VARLAGVCRKTGSLGVMGITPTGPETAYGYILAGEPAGRGFRVGRFVEKPDRRKASRLLAGGNATWNSGMFLFPLGVLREEMGRHCPGLWEAAEAWLDGDPGPYTSWPKISVDYALMEKSARVAMVPGDFGWSDVGTFPALHALLPKDEAGNAGWGPGLAEGCERSLIVTARAGTLVRGLRDHVHVEGPGGILSVPMAAAGDIREGVEAILRRG
jgi:mannose-1-phosphate guanylyltransferase